jgi:TRAP-type C4-dicarboxylate transport system substrate-binding protein
MAPAAGAIFPEGLSLPPRITLHVMKAFRLLLATLAAMAAVASVHAAENPSALIPRYEKISAALATDNLTDAHAAARQLAAEAARLHRGGIAAAARTVAKAGDLAGARGAFKALSIEVVALAKHAAGYFILTCPMAQADWVQSTRAVANPYLGRDMLTCGELKEETKG